MSEVSPRSRSNLAVATVLIASFLVMSVFAAMYTASLFRPPGSSSPTCQSPPCSAQLGENASVDVVVPMKMSVSMALNVTVFRSATDRTVLANSYQAHDLLVNNFFYWLESLFLNAPSLSSTVVSGLKNTAGTSMSVDSWNSGGGAVCAAGSVLNPCVFPSQGGLVEVGTGSTAAARTDYSLTTPYQSFVGVTNACVAGSTDSVTISGAETANTGATITESGLFIQSYSNGAGLVFMLSHDVFAGVVVSGGNTITVQYTLSLNNAGFNANFCQWFAGVLSQPNGAGNSVKAPTQFLTYTDTAGRTDGYCPMIYGGSGTYGGWLYSLTGSNPTTTGCQSWTSGQTANAVQICVGTGSSAFTPTSYALTSQYQCNYTTTASSYDGAGNLYMTTALTLATGATISEAGIFITLPATCVNYSPNAASGAGTCGSSATATTMWLAQTFTGQAVPNGGALGVTFQISG